MKTFHVPTVMSPDCVNNPQKQLRLPQNPHLKVAVSQLLQQLLLLPQLLCWPVFQCLRSRVLPVLQQQLLQQGWLHPVAARKQRQQGR